MSSKFFATLRAVEPLVELLMLLGLLVALWTPEGTAVNFYALLLTTIMVIIYAVTLAARIHNIAATTRAICSYGVKLGDLISFGYHGFVLGWWKKICTGLDRLFTRYDCKSVIIITFTEFALNKVQYHQSKFETAFKIIDETLGEDETAQQPTD